MEDGSFIDFYELLEIEFDATDDVIEQRFRQFATQAHPDTADADAVEMFSRSMEAYETLTDPELRAAYNVVYNSQKEPELERPEPELELLEDANCIEDDSAQRHRLLSFFYAKRRKTMEDPGIGGETLGELSGIPSNVLKFHMWYFKENDWIKREENGQFAITASGVDKIESRVEIQPLEKLSLNGATVDQEAIETEETPDAELETVGDES